jgi:hypothetical protein
VVADPPFDHSDPDDPLRHIGKGVPLHGTSWLNRPYHVGWFVGGLFGDDLQSGLEQDAGAFGGYRLGHDFDHYYGKELRFGFGYLELNNGQPAQPNSADYFLDAHLLHYPWGMPAGGRSLP